MNTFKKLAALGLISASLALQSSAATYYCDPVHGLPTNPGTSASPWRRLEEVFSAGKTFASGDTIYLRSGNHGNPVITGGSSGTRTIIAQSGQAPVMRTLTFAGGATHWTVSSVLVSPEEANGSFTNGPLVNLEAGATNNVFEDSQVHYATDATAATWDNTAWVNNSGQAINVTGINNQILYNKIRNAHQGVIMNRTSTGGAGATGSVVIGNSIIHFWEDAFDIKVSNCIVEYNYAANSYAVVPPGRESDPPHRDFVQSYRGDGSFTPVDGDIVRGNVFIARIGTRYTKIPFVYNGHYTIQGISLFDGPYSNWLIENNVVMNEVGLGMSLYGVSNSTIVNNTIVCDPQGSAASGVRITSQKGGAASSNNDILRNNLMAWYDIGAATNLHQSNNITIPMSQTSNYFVNYGACNVHLKAGSPAINAGTTTDAPKIDADEHTRTVPYDVGAYEF